MSHRSNTPKMHHFVPRSYLARFTDKNGFLHIFDRSSRKFRRQRPSGVMKINNYYLQEWAPSGVDPNIFEKSMGEWLETAAKISLDRLIHHPSELTDDDTAILLIYLEVQRIRVPRQGEAAKKMMREALLRMIPADIADDVHSGKVLLTMKDSARFDYMKMSVGTLHPWFGGMEWEVIEACEGAAFVTTDSPISFYNSQTPPPAEPGLALAGTIVFFPLSSRHVLLMRHPIAERTSSISQLSILPEPAVEDGQIAITHGCVWDKDVVNNFNWKMTQLSGHLVVAEDKEILDACIGDRT